MFTLPRSARLAAIVQFLKGVGLLALVVVPAWYVHVMGPEPDGVSLGAARQITPADAGLAPGTGPAIAPAAGLPILRSVPLVRVNVPEAADAAGTPWPVEQEIVAYVNVDRQERGLSPVDHDSALLPLARARAVDQLQRASLSHFDAFGRVAFGGLLAEAQIPFTLAGENLARLGDGPEVSAAAHRALMNSPTHRRNILEPRFNRMAVGSTDVYSGRIALAQLFRAAP